MHDISKHQQKESLNRTQHLLKGNSKFVIHNEPDFLKKTKSTILNGIRSFKGISRHYMSWLNKLTPILQRPKFGSDLIVNKHNPINIDDKWTCLQKQYKGCKVYVALSSKSRFQWWKQKVQIFRFNYSCDKPRIQLRYFKIFKQLTLFMS